MSQINEIFTHMASSPEAFKQFIAAMEALLETETAVSNGLTQRALFYPEDRARACVSVGRCEMLADLVKKMKTCVRQTT